MVWGEICSNVCTKLYICQGMMTGLIYARNTVYGGLSNLWDML